MTNLEISILKARMLCNARELISPDIPNKTMVKMVLGVRETLATRRCYEMKIDQLGNKLEFNKIKRNLERSYKLAKESRTRKKATV